MSKFRKKPVVIEAWRFLPDAIIEPSGWLSCALASGNAWFQGGDEPHLTIRTLEGEMRANVGDWIIRGVEGEIYPCKPAIFNKSYEPDEDTPDPAARIAELEAALRAMRPHIATINRAAMVNDQYGRVVHGQTDAARALAEIIAALGDAMEATDAVS